MFTTQNIVLNINLIEVMPSGWKGEKEYSLQGAMAYLEDMEIQYDLYYHEEQFTVKGGHFIDDEIIHKNQSTTVSNIRIADEDGLITPVSEEEELLIIENIKSKIDIK